MCRVLKFMLVMVCVLMAGCNLQSGTPTLIPTPNIPRVEFQFPQNNSTVLEGTDLNIDLVGSDPGSGVARIELLVDDQPHQEGKPTISPEVPTFTVKMNWLAQGVVPIVGTKADNLEGDHRINHIVACLAQEYDVPLWNFWAAIQPLPNHGLQPDLEHLTYGVPDFSNSKAMQTAWTVRNLTALQALDAVWRGVNP